MVFAEGPFGPSVFTGIKGSIDTTESGKRAGIIAIKGIRLKIFKSMERVKFVMKDGVEYTTD